MCLSLGCGADPDGPGAAVIHELSTDAEFDTVHEIDDIFVFDLTESDNPKYAIIQLTEHDGIRMGTGGEYVEVDTKSDAFRRNTTLKASKYLLCYRQDTSAASPQALDSLPQLDVAAFTSVWPHGNFRGRKSGNGSDGAEDAKSPTDLV